MTPEDFMRRAIALSIDQVHSCRGGPFGAVVVKEGRIIAEGGNEVTSANDPTAHAEIVAIRKACAHINSFSLAGCEIYTSCEPCPMCLSAIYWARIDRIFFGNGRVEAAAAGFDDAFFYQEIPMPLSERLVPILQMLPNEAQAAFDAWQSKTDKTPY